MKIRRDLFVVALATFCLTASLFMIRASRSGWDPWADIKEDGTVDIYDAIMLSNAFGTSGDTTKNVTIAGHANTLAFNVSTIVSSGNAYVTDWILVDGYSKVTICIGTDASENFYRLSTSHFGGPVYFVDEMTNFGTYLVKTYDVPNEQIQVTFVNNGASSRHLYLDVYLIP